jgi:hypothetical protein
LNYLGELKMNKFIIALMAVMMLFIAGCASTKGGTPIDLGDSSPLEEIAPYDDEAVEALPDMVAAEM